MFNSATRKFEPRAATPRGNGSRCTTVQRKQKSAKVQRTKKRQKQRKPRGWEGKGQKTNQSEKDLILCRFHPNLTKRLLVSAGRGLTSRIGRNLAAIRTSSRREKSVLDSRKSPPRIRRRKGGKRLPRVLLSLFLGRPFGNRVPALLRLPMILSPPPPSRRPLFYSWDQLDVENQGEKQGVCAPRFVYAPRNSGTRRSYGRLLDR